MQNLKADIGWDSLDISDDEIWSVLFFLPLVPTPMYLELVVVALHFLTMKISDLNVLLVMLTLILMTCSVNDLKIIKEEDLVNRAFEEALKVNCFEL